MTYETIPPFSRYGQGDAHMSLWQVLKNSGYDPDVAPFPGLMGPVYNVKAFGAKGDGVTDDTTALGSAAAVATGANLWLPPGTYITTQLSALAGCMLIGSGPGVSIIKRKSSSIANGNSNNTGAVIFFNAGLAGLSDPGTHLQFCGARDLTIDGNAAGNTGVTNANLGCHGFRASYSDFVFLENVEIKNCLDSGFYLFGCSKSRHIGCVSHGNGQISVASSRNGFSVTGPQDDATDRAVQDEHIFIGCESYSNTDEGFAIGRNGRIIIAGCISHDNGDMGIEGDSGTATSDTTSVPAGWIIANNHVYSNGTHGIGISNANVQRIAAIGNVVEDNPGDGITLANTSGALAIVADNIIRNWGTAAAGNHGIIISSGFNAAVVADNLLEGGSGTLSTGIVFIAQAAARRAQITGNLIIAAGGGGLAITGALTGRIAGNIVDTTVSASTRGFVISSGSSGAVSDLIVEDNQALNCISDGFLVRTNGTAAITNLRFRGNKSRGNGATGVTFSESGGGVITGLEVENNSLGGNTGAGISGTPAAGFAVKRNNRYSTGAVHGTAALSSGTVTVNTAEVVASDTIHLTRVVAGGTARGILTVGTITAGTSFVITAQTTAAATETNDTSTVFWEIVH